MYDIMHMLKLAYPDDYPKLTPQILINNMTMGKGRNKIINKLTKFLDGTIGTYSIPDDMDKIMQLNFSPKVNGFKISTTP